jgi:hypothetical protein
MYMELKIFGIIERLTCNSFMPKEKLNAFKFYL